MRNDPNEQTSRSMFNQGNGNEFVDMEAAVKKANEEIAAAKAIMAR